EMASRTSPQLLRTSFQSAGAGPTLPSGPAPVRRTRLGHKATPVPAPAAPANTPRVSGLGGNSSGAPSGTTDNGRCQRARRGAQTRSGARSTACQSPLMPATAALEVQRRLEDEHRPVLLEPRRVLGRGQVVRAVEGMHL